MTKRDISPPKKTLTKRGTELFAADDVDVLRQIDSKSKSTAFVVLAGLLPTIQSFFLFFFKQKTAYEISACLVGSEMCIRDRKSSVPLFVKVFLGGDISLFVKYYVVPVLVFDINTRIKYLV